MCCRHKRLLTGTAVVSGLRVRWRSRLMWYSSQRFQILLQIVRHGWRLKRLRGRPDRANLEGSWRWVWRMKLVPRNDGRCSWGKMNMWRKVRHKWQDAIFMPGNYDVGVANVIGNSPLTTKLFTSAHWQPDVPKKRAVWFSRLLWRRQS